MRNEYLIYEARSLNKHRMYEEIIKTLTTKDFYTAISEVEGEIYLIFYKDRVINSALRLRDNEVFAGKKDRDLLLEIDRQSKFNKSELHAVVVETLSLLKNDTSFPLIIDTMNSSNLILPVVKTIEHKRGKLHKVSNDIIFDCNITIVEDGITGKFLINDGKEIRYAKSGKIAKEARPIVIKTEKRLVKAMKHVKDYEIATEMCEEGIYVRGDKVKKVTF